MIILSSESLAGSCVSQHIWKNMKATNPHIPYSIVWNQRCAIWSPILLGTTYWPFFSKNPNIYIAIAIGSIFNLSIGLVLLLLLLKSQILACSQCNIVTVLLLYISLLSSKRIKSMFNIREN